jgi:hypothetical protein
MLQGRGVDDLSQTQSVPTDYQFLGQHTGDGLGREAPAIVGIFDQNQPTAVVASVPTQQDIAEVFHCLISSSSIGSRHLRLIIGSIHGVLASSESAPGLPEVELTRSGGHPGPGLRERLVTESGCRDGRRQHHWALSN